MQTYVSKRLHSTVETPLCRNIQTDITSENRSELLFIENDSVNARLYIREIPIPHAQLVLAVTDTAAVLFIVLCIIDITPPHRADEIDVYLSEVRI